MNEKIISDLCSIAILIRETDEDNTVGSIRGNNSINTTKTISSRSTNAVSPYTTFSEKSSSFSPSLTSSSPTSNIDAGILTHDDTEKLIIMRHQESTTYKCKDYTAWNHNYRATKSIDEEWRKKICQWCFNVANSYKFQRNTVYVAISILDRFLGIVTTTTKEAGILQTSEDDDNDSSNPLTDCKHYQLVSMTAFYIAIKIHERNKLSPEFLAQRSNGLYHGNDIEEMEKRILAALKWRVNGPTSNDFIQYFIDLIPRNCIDENIVHAIMENSLYQVDLALIEYYSFECLPSKIALAAICNTISVIDERIFPLQIKNEFLHNVEKYSGLVLNKNCCDSTNNNSSENIQYNNHGAEQQQYQYNNDYNYTKMVQQQSQYSGSNQISNLSNLSFVGIDSSRERGDQNAIMRIHPESPISVASSNKRDPPPRN